MKELSIYIHIPFCKSKCFYCDFASYANKELIYNSYIDSLILEIKTLAKNYKGYKVQTIFIGGGTPTILPYNLILKVIEQLNLSFNIDCNCEITIESNPGTIQHENLLAFRKSGINRISIGLQAWQDEFLKKLGRIHTKEEFITGFNLAREVGFNNINVDLMFALPNQTIADWEETLNNVIKLNPEHISTYSLIVEENTPFYNQNLQLPDENADRQMYYIAKQLLKSNYIHYEISNFAKDNFLCRHNIVYWKQKEYLGLGLGAHSYINNTRFHNTYNIDKYISQQNIIEDVEENDIVNNYAEYMFLGLRLLKGVSKSEFKLKFKKDIYEIYNKQLNECKKLGLIQDDKGFIFLTDKGIDVSNIVFEKFL